VQVSVVVQINCAAVGALRCDVLSLGYSVVVIHNRNEARTAQRSVPALGGCGLATYGVTCFADFACANKVSTSLPMSIEAGCPALMIWPWLLII
jgi:hypothetical protein